MDMIQDVVNSITGRRLAAALADSSRKQKLIEMLCLSSTEDDTAIRSITQKHGMEVEGDTFGVPGIADCVEELSNKLTTALAERDAQAQIIHLMEVARDKHQAQFLAIRAREAALRTTLGRIEHGFIINDTYGSLEVIRKALAAPADNGLLDAVVKGLEEIVSNDPETNRQHADEIANRILGLFRNTRTRP